jgi:hypothetical protein
MPLTDPERISPLELIVCAIVATQSAADAAAITVGVL